MASTNFGISRVLGWSRVGDWRQWHHLAVVIDGHREDHRPQRFGERWDVKAPMGHRLPHAFRADGSFIFTFEEAIAFLVKRLYPGSLPSPTAQSPGTRKKRNRDSEIRARYAQGASEIGRASCRERVEMSVLAVA